MSHVVNQMEMNPTGQYGYYFGYGLESVPEVMDAILGRSVRAELGVSAVKRQLAIQEIDQVPELQSDAFGGKSPQEVLASSWAPYTDKPFSSYVLLDSGNRGDIVSGTLYEVGINDIARINEWDLAALPVRKGDRFTFPGWRYLDRMVELADGRKVATMTTYREQLIDRVVDGVEYNPFLNDKDITLHVIQDAMRRFED